MYVVSTKPQATKPWSRRARSQEPVKFNSKREILKSFIRHVSLSLTVSAQTFFTKGRYVKCALSTICKHLSQVNLPCLMILPIRLFLMHTSLKVESSHKDYFHILFFFPFQSKYIPAKLDNTVNTSYTRCMKYEKYFRFWSYPSCSKAKDGSQPSRYQQFKRTKTNSK